MVLNKVIRAWKDPEFRAELSEEELTSLPQSPAGAIELTDDELDAAAGGSWHHSRSYTSRSASHSRSASWRRPPSRSWRRSMSRSHSYSRSRSYSYR